VTSKNPDAPSLNPRFYPKTELEVFADEFLQLYNASSVFPVDIEVIIERDLEISILPFSELKRMYGIEAYLTLSKRNIYVDPFLMDLDQNEKRYRFTLAEEVAHGILHKDLFTGIKTPEDYLALYDKMNPSDYRKMDKDAKYLGAAILMPRSAFQDKAAEYYEELVDGQNAATIQYQMIDKLAEFFHVSEFSTGIRFQELGLSGHYGPNI
jgi:Zn-dependent peptidase ImmA (M78 family)